MRAPGGLALGRAVVPTGKKYEKAGRTGKTTRAAGGRTMTVEYSEALAPKIHLSVRPA